MSLAFSKKVQTCTTTLSRSSFGQLRHRKAMLSGWNNNTKSNPFADGLSLSRESSKVCFELLKTFRVTPRKPCRLVAPPKSGNLFLTCGNRVLFLVLNAVLFHFVIQGSSPDAE